MATGLDWTHDADTITRLWLWVDYECRTEHRRLRWWSSRRHYRHLRHGVAVLDAVHAKLREAGTLTIPLVGLGDRSC